MTCAVVAAHSLKKTPTENCFSFAVCLRVTLNIKVEDMTKRTLRLLLSPMFLLVSGCMPGPPLSAYICASFCIYVFAGFFYRSSPRFFNAVSRAFFHTPSAFVIAVFADSFHSFASFFIFFSWVFQSLCFHRLLVNRCCCIFCIQSISFTTFPLAMVLAEPFFVNSISLENSENFKKEIFTSMLGLNSIKILWYKWICWQPFPVVCVRF